MKEKLFEAIVQYQEDVFEYRTAEMTASFLAMVNALEYWATHIFQEHDRPLLNQLLQIMLNAYQYKDYLLVADLAEYELKPLAVRAQSGEK